jgi:hypothetical protein
VLPPGGGVVVGVVVGAGAVGVVGVAPGRGGAAVLPPGGGVVVGVAVGAGGYLTPAGGGGAGTGDGVAF